MQREAANVLKAVPFYSAAKRLTSETGTSVYARNEQPRCGVAPVFAQQCATVTSAPAQRASSVLAVLAVLVWPRLVVWLPFPAPHR